MTIKINPLGNGACPLCIHAGKCVLHSKLRDAVSGIKDKGGTGMEIVVYSCPSFKEKA